MRRLVAVAAGVLVAGSSFFPFPGGVPSLNWPLWILHTASNSPQAAMDPSVEKTLKSLFQTPVPWLALHPRERAEALNPLPSYRRIYDDFYAHPAFDEYWKQPGFYVASQYRQMKDIPMFFLTGWYDYAEGVLENFVALSRLQSTPKKLMVGPWPHATGKAECGDAAYGAPAEIDQTALALDWLDHWMKGSAFRLVKQQPVEIFRMGGGSGNRTATGRLDHGGQWRAAQTWPPSGYTAMKYYLRGGKLLDRTRPAREEPDSFVYDPENPAPSIGGRYGFGSRICAQNQVCSPGFPGCKDSSPLNARPDVLSFESAPLTSPADLTGKVRARLWISSDAVDTDFTARLIDVYPDGFAMILLDGMIRARFRESIEKARLMKPGKVYEVMIDLGSTSNLFMPGHRIRLDISSSSFPKLEPNTNTGEPPGSWTRRRKARNTIYHDTARSSYLELPLANP